nr:hypothetical protein [Salmonella enterica subsp. enterica serovar Weltevreden]
MWQTWTAFCKDVGAFVAIAHVCGLRCVGFGKHQVADNAESRIFPGSHKAIDAVPAVEALPSACLFSARDTSHGRRVAAIHRFYRRRWYAPDGHENRRDMAGR